MHKKPLTKLSTHLLLKLFKNGHRRNIPQHSKGHIWQAYRKHYSQWWKTESIPPKIRNKTRVSTFTTIIQHSSGISRYSNQRRKINKINSDQKRRRKALTVCRWHDTVSRTPKDSTRKLLELISKFSKVSGYKINT